MLPLVLLAACKPEPAPHASPWSPCYTDGVQCASVEVPYDHADPEGPSLNLLVSRSLATGPRDQRQGAILMNFGGPGVAGSPYVAGMAKALPEVHAAYDFVSWDPRGSGGSAPLGCMVGLDDVLDAPMGSTDPADLQAVIDAMARFWDGCRISNPDLVDHMSMDDWADDLDDVRAALGLDQISYYGVSGGTSLGLTYADRYPDRVDRMVLDSTIPAFGGMESESVLQSQGTPGVVAGWADWCATDPGCSDQLGPDPLGAVSAVLDQARDAPLAGDGRKLTWGRAAYGVVDYFYAESRWPDLGPVVVSAANGDPEPLLAASDGYFGRDGGVFSPLLGEWALVECSDSTFRPTPAELAAEVDAQESAYGTAGGVERITPLENAWCSAFDSDVDPVAGEAVADGAPPILFLQSLQDVATPLVGALEAQAALAAPSPMVVYDGATHGVLFVSSCEARYAQDFWLSGALPPDQTVCAD